MAKEELESPSLSWLLEELNCTICYEARKLLLLPCQHTFCGECLERIANGEGVVSCPTCRRQFEVPTANFPTCRLAMAVREQIEEHISKLSAIHGSELKPAAHSTDNKSTSQIVCENCERTLETRCLYCKQFLCYRCVVKSPCTVVQTERHEVTDIELVMTEADNALTTWRFCVDQELSKIKNLRERKDKKAVVVATQDVVDSETDLVQRISIIEKLTKKDINGMSMLEDKDRVKLQNQMKNECRSRQTSDTVLDLRGKIEGRLSFKKGVLRRLSREQSSPKEQKGAVNAERSVETERKPDIEEPEDYTVRGTALYQFVMDDSNMDRASFIDLDAGEEFIVQTEDNGDGWTRIVKKNGGEGFVPTSYIEIK